MFKGKGVKRFGCLRDRFLRVRVFKEFGWLSVRVFRAMVFKG